MPAPGALRPRRPPACRQLSTSRPSSRPGLPSGRRIVPQLKNNPFTFPLASRWRRGHESKGESKHEKGDGPEKKKNGNGSLAYFTCVWQTTYPAGYLTIHTLNHRISPRLLSLVGRRLNTSKTLTSQLRYLVAFCLFFQSLLFFCCCKSPGPGGSDKGEMVAPRRLADRGRHVSRPRLTVMNEPSGRLIIRHSQAERGPLIITYAGGGGRPHFLIQASSLPTSFHPSLLSSSVINGRAAERRAAERQSVARDRLLSDPECMHRGQRGGAGQENVVEMVPSDFADCWWS